MCVIMYILYIYLKKLIMSVYIASLWRFMDTQTSGHRKLQFDMMNL